MVKETIEETKKHDVAKRVVSIEFGKMQSDR